MSSVITLKTVDENAHLAFLRHKLHEQYLEFQVIVHDIAIDTIEKFVSCADWDLIELSNQGFYKRPLLGGEKLIFQNKHTEYNGFVSEDAAGIILTILGLTIMRRHLPGIKSLYNYQQALIEYVNFHEEKTEILAAISKQK
jgi:hypothetical protein